VHLNVVNDTTRRNVDDSGAGNKNIYRRPDQRGRLQVCGQTERTLVEATETGARVVPRTCSTITFNLDANSLGVPQS